jgi:peptidoglycan/xylan/chitin deacetylase (PgdA/CDA1 family)
LKNRDSLHRLFDSWQYVMLAVAIFIAIIFCCYYIVSQSRWGFYTSGGIHDVENPVFSPLKEVVTDGDKEAETKRAYLTFDDGPSGNTGEILDILDANDVKATFFVVGRGDEYYDTYRDIVGRGHTLALHSYTHDYDKIYASLDDFAEDIEELRNLLYDVTGVNCVYYRFPGGSSNTVSKVDMDTLIDYVESQGLIYYDWNALNNDAVCGSYTPEQLVDNIMKDAVCHDDVVILMHDLDARHCTVESLQMLIDELRAEGFTLLPIDENAPLVRHR